MLGRWDLAVKVPPHVHPCVRTDAIATTVGSYHVLIILSSVGAVGLGGKGPAAGTMAKDGTRPSCPEGSQAQLKDGTRPSCPEGSLAQLYVQTVQKTV